jgi:signal transduction histidine kinase
VGRAFTAVLRDCPELARVLTSAFDSDDLPNRAEMRLRKTGRAIGYTLSRIHDDEGVLVGATLFFKDLTRVEQIEERERLRDRLATLGEMAAAIAHEIRNPLASMSGSIQILRQELPLSAEQEQLMDIVLRESERLNTTIKSFLAYARPQRFSVTRFDLRRAVNDAALLLRNSSEVLEGHTIEVDVPPHEVWYEADEGQIKQIVWNLATNGLRAMLSGGRLVLSATAEREGPQDELAITIVPSCGPG